MFYFEKLCINTHISSSKPLYVLLQLYRSINPQRSSGIYKQFIVFDSIILLN
ncbi:hypothetical protein HanRHA438_Chr07g0299671 [Helianthus annuus]|nr:hypothetical protein HanRHA438_Chr07g0299671 [Helianthus annuus]